MIPKRRKASPQRKPIDIVSSHFKLKETDTIYRGLVKLFLIDPDGIVWGLRAVRVLSETRHRKVYVSHIHRLLRRLCDSGLIRDIGDSTVEVYGEHHLTGTAFSKLLHVRMFKANKYKLVSEL